MSQNIAIQVLHVKSEALSALHNVLSIFKPFWAFSKSARALSFSGTKDNVWC